jgi:hypothetical protein
MTSIETPSLADSQRPSSLTHRWTTVVVACLAVWLLMRVVFFVGFEGSDDMQHVRYANLWDRVPASHWETRLIANVLIGGAMKVFGYTEWAATLPSLLGSLMILATTLLACRWLGTIQQAWWAGMLVAVVPLDISNATIVSAHTLMVGFLTAGSLAFVMAPQSRRASAIAAVCLSLSVVIHDNAIPYLGALVIAAIIIDWRAYLRTIIALCIAGVAFLLADMLVFKLLSGDALLRFRLSASDNRDPVLRDGLTLQMAFWSVQQLIAGKPFGIAMSLASIGMAIHYRRFSRPVRLLCLTAVIFWLLISFGSYLPWAYRPFARVGRYLHPLLLPIALVFAATIVHARHKRLATAVGVAALALCPVILSSGGTWGQSIRTSQELLSYALQHPEQTFVTDVYTANEIYIVNGLSTPSNVVGTTDYGLTGFLDRTIRRTPAPTANSCDALLINPLNVERDPQFAAMISKHLGARQYETALVLRPICQWIPFLRNSRWAVRRPPAAVYACEDASGATTKPPADQESTSTHASR